MQFGEDQYRELRRNWHGGSWFFRNLGLPARTIIELAYGFIQVPVATPNQRARAQEDVTLALSIFARTIGCDKSHAVHALLTGSYDGLIRALERNNGHAPSEQEIRDAWEAAFRDINVG